MALELWTRGAAGKAWLSALRVIGGYLTSNPIQANQIAAGVIPTVPSAATQAEEEAGSSTTVFTTPGRQKFHPAHPKVWAYVTVSGGVPTVAASFGLHGTPIADVGPGILQINFLTAFSSVNYCVLVTTTQIDSASQNVRAAVLDGTQNTTDVQLINEAASTGGNTDPVAWHVVIWGDQ